jgi:hypothetical protein
VYEPSLKNLTRSEEKVEQGWHDYKEMIPSPPPTGLQALQPIHFPTPPTGLQALHSISLPHRQNHTQHVVNTSSVVASASYGGLLSSARLHPERRVSQWV